MVGRLGGESKELFEMELAFHLGKNSSVASPQKVEEAENRLFAQIDKHEEHTIKTIDYISSVMLQR